MISTFPVLASHLGPATCSIINGTIRRHFRTEREAGGLAHVFGTIPGAETGGRGDELLRRETAQTLPQHLRRRYPNAPELVRGLGVRAFTAERRAALSTRIISTRPSALFGSPALSPANTALAAASASRESDFPFRRR